MDLPSDILETFYDYMMANTQATNVLRKAGFRELIAMLKQYVWCNFGAFDNTPDLSTESNELIHEHWDCGKRENCPFNCKVWGRLITYSGEDLTKQEVTILKLIARGMYDAELADALNISPTTIIAHKANIFRKINAHSKVDCAVFAMRNNLV
jgi:DNA-binding CsgD family transcriptional regulator